MATASVRRPIRSSRRSTPMPDASERLDRFGSSTPALGDRPTDSLFGGGTAAGAVDGPIGRDHRVGLHQHRRCQPAALWRHRRWQIDLDQSQPQGDGIADGTALVAAERLPVHVHRSDRRGRKTSTAATSRGRAVCQHDRRRRQSVVGGVEYRPASVPGGLDESVRLFARAGQLPGISVPLVNGNDRAGAGHSRSAPRTSTCGTQRPGGPPPACDRRRSASNQRWGTASTPAPKTLAIRATPIPTT